MKIATWNIDRLKAKKNIPAITEIIKGINADILILTEFNNLLELPFYEHKIETIPLPRRPYNYAETERRVAIFSHFPINKTYKSYDAETSCCAEIETDYGKLIIYGTIVGITGYTDANFKSDLKNQIEDIKSLSQLGNLCYTGDLNTSFCDNFYFTHFGRDNFNDCFKQNNLKNITENIPNTIDHIVVNKAFMTNFEIEITEWNVDLKLSDHKGICVNFKIGN